MNTALDTASHAQVSRVENMLTRLLGDDVIGMYLFGSAMNGGLRPKSDIDILLAVKQPIVGDRRVRLVEQLLALSGDPKRGDRVRPVEVTAVVIDDIKPWRYPARRDLQFGEWLRDELVAKRIPPPTFDPDLAILFTMLRQRSVALFGPPATELFDPIPTADLNRALAETTAQWTSEDTWEGDERNVLLALARIWVTRATGAIFPKDVAATWALERLPPAHRPALELARAAYLGECEDDWTNRTEEVEACIRHMKGAIEAITRSDRSP
ncbi:DUF4111 domain-containing protein [Archangium violaceum]|uniref:aminoglycoside adenylyltransferase family protein n=1 Tax=Archangium violaceum TaxID=83451 RepID=UPI00193C3A2A|nr:aminoglycoside adenylyltransferase family protein [Archangium violaceum]QRK12923.1 DUF4111 domain-containing protein [Archangium violaceum]